MTRDFEKLSILIMFRGSLTNIENMYWNNCGFPLKSDISKDFPASLEQENIHYKSFNNVLRSLMVK